MLLKSFLAVLVRVVPLLPLILWTNVFVFLWLLSWLWSDLTCVTKYTREQSERSIAYFGVWILRFKSIVHAYASFGPMVSRITRQRTHAEAANLTKKGRYRQWLGTRQSFQDKPFLSQARHHAQNFKTPLKIAPLARKAPCYIAPWQPYFKHTLLFFEKIFS